MVLSAALRGAASRGELSPEPMHVCNDPAHARLARNVEKVKQKLADTSKLIALYNDAKAQLGSQGQQLAALRA